MNKKFTLLFFLSFLIFRANSQVVISQYYEGTGTNKWIEITNMGSSNINLTSPQLRIGLWAVSGSGGNITFTGPPTATMDLTGTIGPGQSFLLGNTGNGTEVPYLTAASANQTNNSVINFNGNDGVALLDASNNFIDQFGLGINAQDKSYVRNTFVTTPNPNYTGSEWNLVTLATVQTAANNNPNYLSYHIPSTIAACSEPQNQPTNLILNPTPTTITVSFTNAAPAADEYMVVRSASSTLSASPVDGVAYAVNTAFGGGTIVSIGTVNNFINTGLLPTTLYYYFVFSLNSEACSGGPNYLNSGPLTGSTNTLALPPCSTPSLPPTNLLLNPGLISVSSSFTAAPGANFYLVVKSLNSSLSASPVDGNTYSAGQSLGGGNVVTYTSNTSFTSLGLTAGTLYYFYVFSAIGDCNGEPFYNSTSLNGSTTTLTGTGIPPGYYDAANSLTCSPLKTALFNIISANYITLSYTPGVWDAYQTTDLHRNDANTADIIWDMYSDNPTGPEPYTYTFSIDQCGNYSIEGDCYNREHSFPKSWFNDASPMYSDLNHLFPTDGKVNNIRDNFPYGEVSAPVSPTPTLNGGKLGPNTYPGFSGTVFEPINQYKGDLARAHLYMGTRYQNLVAGWQNNGNANDVLNGTSYQAFDDWVVKLMYKWHTQDPVSQKEIDRNNAVYSLQGNRNPFIDHPEYVSLVWQCTGVLPVTIIDFTAQKNSESVLLKWYATAETNFKKYEIEGSIDGSGFYKIGEVAGRNLANYSYTDYNLPNANTVFYRLKMIDIDGQFSNSKIVSVRMANNFPYALVYPNPAKGQLVVKLQHALTTTSQLIIADLSGRIVMQQQVTGGQRNIDLTVNDLPAGRYFIKLSNSSELINQSFVIIK